MEDVLKKLFDARLKNIKYHQWFMEIMVDALHKGEQFHKDHGRPMTYEEKIEWVESKRKLMQI